MDLQQRKRIGQILCDMGYLNQSQLEQGLKEQRKGKHQLIGEILLELGFITQAQLEEALAVKV